MISLITQITFLWQLTWTATGAPPDVSKYWVYLKDKGRALSHQDFLRSSRLSERALKRRSKVRNSSTSILDLPLRADYIEQLQSTEVLVVSRSRWLNAVSVEATADQVSLLRQLAFVTGVRPVATARVSRYLGDYNYGPSLDQNEIVNVPRVHREKDLAGRGVLIAVFDTGFNSLLHEVFDSLNIEAAYDFVNNDTIVDDQNEDENGSHGGQVLSVIASFEEGRLIGPAFRASYLLAKVMNNNTESLQDEDHWIEALEWAELNGADIVQSSISFIEGYSHADIDGNSIPVTVAANIAVDSFGIVVINSAGNEGETAWERITAPGDGKSVIAVGAVTADGQRASFSSIGPNSSGQKKPDVAALGFRVRVATRNKDIDSYTDVNGTSFSAPMVSGLAAMILEDHPEWTPKQVRDALRKTASRGSNPNNEIGWGVVDAFRAIEGPSSSIQKTFENLTSAPNPFNTQARISFFATADGTARVRLYNSLGQLVFQTDQIVVRNTETQVLWNGKTQQGKVAASGVYLCRVSLQGYSESMKMMVLK